MSMMAQVVHHGRRYFAMAQFDGEQRQAQAEEYRRTHPHTAVLCEQEATIYVTHDRDFGVVVDAVDSEFGTKGWTSMIVGPVPR